MTPTQARLATTALLLLAAAWFALHVALTLPGGTS